MTVIKPPPKKSSLNYSDKLGSPSSQDKAKKSSSGSGLMHPGQLQDIPVRYLKGIGPSRAIAFANHGIMTIEDLLYYFPRRYEDRTKFIPIAMISEGQPQTVKARIVTINQRQSWRRKGFSITQAVLDDRTGRMECVWFNQPYLKQYLKPQKEIILYGRPARYAGRLQMSNPEFELVTDEGTDDSLDIGRIVPVYTAPSGIGQRRFRRLMRQALDKYITHICDFLPPEVRSRQGLEGIKQSILNIHFPQTEELRQQAYARLAFDEFFLFQVPLIMSKLKKKQVCGIRHNTAGQLIDTFIKGLPFALTESQQKALDEIRSDMASSQPMQRLLQGDVGSGKTVVATAAAVMAIQGGYQAAMMVPTEILAKQHFEKISLQAPAIRVGLLTSGLSKKEHELLIEQIQAGDINLIIGTHALLEEDVRFRRLGLVIIDEQHRFGVGQRALLPHKGDNPDVLIMTATPIPRTLAITIYGDLDISTITGLPPGRQPIKTQWITPDKRPWLYQFIRHEVNAGRQVYVVYPLIDESYAMDLLSAEKMYEEFKNKIFKDMNVGLIHGRLSQSQQDAAMADFQAGRINILIATTVLEVGIDVANATCMVIEHADRFGLSQLHQLRGRIGRGPHASTCILVSDAATEEARARLEAMVSSNDGFVIAEEDLRIRGPGEYFGSRQHGLTGLRIGNPLAQMQLLKKARQEAVRLLAGDPDLKQPCHQLLKLKIVHRFPEYEKLSTVG